MSNLKEQITSFKLLEVVCIVLFIMLIVVMFFPSDKPNLYDSPVYQHSHHTHRLLK